MDKSETELVQDVLNHEVDSYSTRLDTHNRDGLSGDYCLGQLHGRALSLKEVHRLFSMQRRQLCRELQYRKRLCTQENHIGPKQEGFLTDGALSHKNDALRLSNYAWILGVISYSAHCNLRTETQDRLTLIR